MQLCNGKLTANLFRPSTQFTTAESPAWWCLLRDGFAVAMLPFLASMAVLIVLIVLTWMAAATVISLLGKTWKWLTTKPHSTLTQNVRR